MPLWLAVLVNSGFSGADFGKEGCDACDGVGDLGAVPEAVTAPILRSGFGD